MDCLKKLRILMNQRNLSEYKLSKLSKVPQSTINSMFKKNNMPSIPTLAALCDGLGVTLSEFFYEPEHPAEKDQSAEELLEKWYLLSKEERNTILKLIELLIA